MDFVECPDVSGGEQEMNPVEAARNFLEKKSERLFLGNDFHFELVAEKHSEAIVKWRSDPKNLELFISTRPLTIDDQTAFLKSYAGRDRVDFILVDSARNLPVGSFSLTSISKNPEIGKLLGSTEYRGRGLAKKATQALLKFAFEELGLRKLSAKTREDNEGNIRLNESLGFKITSKDLVDGRTFLTMTLERAS